MDLRCIAVLSLLLAGVAGAAELADDRADVFYSDYRGGGMDITGKSILVRKKFAETFAVEANYFVDTVSGASIDVLSNASPIKDERKQKSVNLEYVRGKTLYSLSYANSKENDYESNTGHFSLSQDMFGDLTTLTLGFRRGWDKVSDHVKGNGIDTEVPKGTADRRGYEAGLSQIITKDLVASLAFEVDEDEGYLNNPYRFVRFCSSAPPTCTDYGLGPEVYPRTRTGTAVQINAKYFLWYRAAVTASYRKYHDTWGIRGNTYQIQYTHPIENRWIFEGRLRYYKQSHADFFSDLFPFANSQNFEARDKDLAASTNTTVGAKVTYAFLPDGWRMFKRGTVTLDVSRIQFKYDDFRNIKSFGATASDNDGLMVYGGFPPGAEPLYKFTANILQIYASLFF